MAAEFDTQPDYIEDDDPPPPSTPNKDDDRRGVWGTLALVILAAFLLLLAVNQFTARVPDITGLARADAESKLKKSGFCLGCVSEVPASNGRSDCVEEQVPAPGTLARRGSGVDLMVGAGITFEAVPDVGGHDAPNASVKLAQAGFEVNTAEEYSDTVPLGAVISQSPAPGERAAEGAVVTVCYSLGPRSAASVAVVRSNTSDGLTVANRGSTGSGVSRLVMNCTRSYPSATAWSSGGDIYVRLYPGARARRVTHTGDWDTDPIISPNHNYLVFLRAPARGEPANGVGAVCFTTLTSRMISMPDTSGVRNDSYYYGKPVFAPSEHSHTPDTDWIVFPQYWTPEPGFGGDMNLRLVICNVPMDSSWVSWNTHFENNLAISLSRSDLAGCVRVTQRGDGQAFARHFNATTGLYLR